MIAPWRTLEAEGWLTRVLASPLAVVAGGYGAVAIAHRAVYERGWRNPRRLPCPVISIGNLIVGGSGKTPMAAWLAANLRARGHSPALLSRGSGRRVREAVTVVSDGRRLCADLDRAGDEPLLLAVHAPGVPVLVGRDRARVGLRALSLFDCDVLVLDDGMQHHRLARDLEIVSFDGHFGIGNGHLLPRGPLREPLAVARRANAIGVVDGPLSESLVRRLDQAAPGARHFVARRTPLRLRPLRGRLPASLEFDPARPLWLEGEEVGLLAGIARPDGFRRTLESLGARVIAERNFRDHHRYRARDLQGLADEAPRWITTEKDAVKLRASWAGKAELLVLEVELGVEEPEALLAWVERGLQRARTQLA